MSSYPNNPLFVALWNYIPLLVLLLSLVSAPRRVDPITPVFLFFCLHFLGEGRLRMVTPAV